MNSQEYCKFCGRDEEKLLEEHHIIPQRYNGEDTNENLVTVCKSCHRTLEEIYNDEVLRKMSNKVEEDHSTSLDEREIVENVFRFIDYDDYYHRNKNIKFIDDGEKIRIELLPVLEDMYQSDVNHLTNNMFSDEVYYLKHLDDTDPEYVEEADVNFDSGIESYIILDIVKADKHIDGFNGSNYLPAEYFV